MASIDHLNMLEIWSLIENTMNENSTPFQNENIHYQFNLTGDDACTRQLILSDGIATISEDVSAEANCTLALSTKDFKKLITGDLNSTTAFMFGKLKVDGSLGSALKLEALLKEYLFEG